MPGFIGEGYIVFDPITGGGAYKITGGGNGGYLSFESLKAFFVESLDVLGVILDAIGFSIASYATDAAGAILTVLNALNSCSDT